MIRILFVDDEPAILETARPFLENEGDILVETESSAEEALKILEVRSFDVIVSDHEMPGMDGLAFLKILRGRGDRTPFIIFSGKSREQVILEALNSGADFFIQKGYDILAQYAEMKHKVRLVVRERRTEARLAESEARYRAVVEDQTEFICRFWPDGTLTFANAAFLKYYGLNSTVIGSRFRPKVPSGELARIQAHLSSLNAGNPTGTIEHQTIMPDGTLHWQQWSDRAILGPDDAIIEYQSVGRDITSRKKADDDIRRYSSHLEELIEERTSKLKEANRFAAIGETTSIIGHDLRNPLQVIFNEIYLGTMRIGQMTPEERAVIVKYRLDLTLNKVEDQSAYMNKIILDLQDFARLVEVSLTPVPVRELLEETLSETNNYPNVAVLNEIDRAVVITADRHLLKRALVNLLMNAFQAIDGSGQVTLSAQDEENQVVICIRDNGPGMDEEQLSKVFSPLYTTKPKGTGLGLNVSRRLIEEQGGRLVLLSRKGMGTTATITLPRPLAGAGTDPGVWT